MKSISGGLCSKCLEDTKAVIQSWRFQEARFWYSK